MDFALWKQAKPGEPSWDSPGAGPPRLAYRMLGYGHEVPGDTVDIHGGGADLVFPHHENEIAHQKLIPANLLPTTGYTTDLSP